MQDHHKFKNFL